MSALETKLVVTKKDFREFIDFPWEIYPRESKWVPPLKFLIRRLLNTRKHPFWKHAEQALFLARQDGRTVGRIAGIVDHNYNKYQHEKMAAWGFFECVDSADAALSLFSAVEEWAHDEGMDFLRGPLNPSTNYEIGLLIDGFEDSPTFMMPYNPPYYLNLIEGTGFSKEKDLLSFYIVQTDPVSPRLARLAKRIKRKSNISIRHGSRKHLEAEVRLMTDIYHEAWADNWGFVPMSELEIKEMARNLFLILEEDLIFFVYYDDEPAGVVMFLPDINPLFKSFNGNIGISGPFKYLFRRHYIKGVRGMLFGLKKKYQRLGLPIVAFDHLNSRMRGDSRTEYWELGWNLEDNDAINKFELELSPRIVKKYRIFKKDIMR